MTERDWLAAQFEEHRVRVRAVAYRMLGSLSEADDAVREVWLRPRLMTVPVGDIEPFGGFVDGRHSASSGRRCSDGTC